MTKGTVDFTRATASLRELHRAGNSCMTAACVAFITPQNAKNWKRRCVYSPLARIILFVLLTLVVSAVVFVPFARLGWTVRASATPLHHAIAGMTLRALPALVAYLVLVFAVERRRAAELSLRDLPRYLALGLLGGLLLLSATVGLLWAAGSYHITGTNPGVDWLPAVLGAGIGAGVGEEVMLRGVVYRIVEEGLGSWWALAISALLFGAMHLANPGATLWSAFAIAIEAGVLLALVYQVTRSLWTCIGLHAAWNICEGTLYGINVSGTTAHGLIVSHSTGPVWLSGGAFGAEASVVMVAVCSLASVVLLAVAIKRGQIVAPFWSRQEQATPPNEAAAAYIP